MSLPVIDVQVTRGRHSEAHRGLARRVRQKRWSVQDVWSPATATAVHGRPPGGSHLPRAFLYARGHPLSAPFQSRC